MGTDATTHDPVRLLSVVKGSRLITHSHRLHGADDAVRTFFSHAAGLKTKLEAVLWQLPPNMRADAARLDAERVKVAA